MFRRLFHSAGVRSATDVDSSANSSASARNDCSTVPHNSRAAGVASAAVAGIETMIGRPSSRCVTRVGVALVPHRVA